uniref:Small ribosomal subunit protein uS14m n=1 Tax=Araucaria cunninghamii TaxID=56994 RepID=A0A0D6R4S4_ARACU
MLIRALLSRSSRHQLLNGKSSLRPLGSSCWRQDVQSPLMDGQSHGIVMPVPDVDAKSNAVASADFSMVDNQRMVHNTAVLVGGFKPWEDGLLQGHAKLANVYSGLELGANIDPEISKQAGSLGKATDTVNRNLCGIGVALFKTSGVSASSIQHGIEAGQIGIEIQRPVPLPLSLFVGSKTSCTSSLNCFRKSGIQFYTQHSRCYSSLKKRTMMDKRNIRDHKCRILAAKYELKRVLYKAALRDPNLPSDLRAKFRDKLSRLPRNSSFVRLRNRCIFTGRSRAVYRKFRMSRIVFRELACKGELTGIRKASW